jgi:hypothetical protein
VKSTGTLYPVEGPGLECLNRGEYQALQHYIRAAGDLPKAEAAMARSPFLAEADKQRALSIFQNHKQTDQCIVAPRLEGSSGAGLQQRPNLVIRQDRHRGGYPGWFLHLAHG